MIQTILIANRGEIACRIIQTCRRLGIHTAAVYSDADVQARHVHLADEAVYLGPAPAPESYLVMEKIIEAARRTGADAVHPGVGFLAENAAFARACREQDLIFIGPTAEMIEAMAHKAVAKALAAEAGVPTIPGYTSEDRSEESWRRGVAQVGFPLMVKAVAGGGGKGMRLVNRLDELAAALTAVRREAQQAFGDDGVMLERVLTNPRHVEVQILGDEQGHIIYLGERECSIQRRHQKIIEEAPAPGLSPALRQQLGQTAVAIAQAIYYQNAGTVEFLLDETGAFYFLEMNTRLQVEHPVTEMLTGIDLVEWQIRIAEGEPLPFTQEAIQAQGHAIEARLYAEDPSRDFLPVTGQIALWQPPQGVRVESGIQTGDTVSVHYDPMLAKVVACGPDRQTAVRRLLHALDTTTLLGFTHNRAFLTAVLRHPAFLAGRVDTHFIERYLSDWQPETADVSLALITVTLVQAASHTAFDGYWRNMPPSPQLYRFRVNEEVVEVWLTPGEAGGQVRLSTAPEQVYTAVCEPITPPAWRVTVDGHGQKVTVAQDGGQWWVQTRRGVVELQALSLLPVPQETADAGGSLRAPMPGSVLAVLVEVGQRVQKGQPLMTLEAMKMEHTIKTAADGVIEAIYFREGDTVEADAQLLKIGPG